MIEVRRVPADSEVALGLVAAMEAWVAAAYGAPSMPTTAGPEELSPPGGAFVVVLVDEEPVAGGGLKRWEDGVCEIKRMFVVPAARGRGLGRRLLEALEDAARELGYTRARLDSGVHNAAAIALYRSAGYADVEDYNGNPLASYWGEKVL